LNVSAWIDVIWLLSKTLQNIKYALNTMIIWKPPNLFNKRWFQFSRCEFSIYICSNIPATPADGVYVSELKRYSASSGSPSWIWLSFIESVLQINTDMIAGHFICLRSWLVTMCDIWPASAAWWMALVEQDCIYHFKSLCLTPVLMGLLLPKL
jgi:hypothetical protein